MSQDSVERGYMRADVCDYGSNDDDDRYMRRSGRSRHNN